MGGHKTIRDVAPEALRLGPEATAARASAFAVGAFALVAAGVLGVSRGADGLQQFVHSYLTAYGYFLALTLGALFFVMVNHLARAGWMIGLRRIFEYMACNLLVLAVLGIPIAWYTVASRSKPGEAHGSGSAKTTEISKIVKTGGLYPWTDAAKVEHNPIVKGKAVWLNVPAWTLRFVLYFLVWLGLAYYFRNTSLKQDDTGQRNLNNQMESVAAPGILLFAITLTLAAIDLLMSLNPVWFSTMWGVYFFAGGMGAFIATSILTLLLLQKFGKLVGVVTVEHYHDLGKFLFGFVFFWGYIAFSQYMLIWYSNLPEETEFLRDRQYIGTSDEFGPWMWVGLTLLFVHVLIPFPGLISRRVKRNLSSLAFWAIWMLGAHAVDHYWIVMPNLSKQIEVQDKLPISPIEPLCLVGIGGILVWNFLRQAANRSLVAVKDPRLEESLNFRNF